MIPILHLLREPESYLHTTAAGAWRENRTAQGFALLKNTHYTYSIIRFYCNIFNFF